MNLLRQHRFATFVLAVLGIVAFAISQLDFGLLFLGVFLATLSWYVTEGPRGRTLPGWAANLAAAGVLAWSLVGFLGEGSLEGAMGALGRFLTWLLVVKLFARRSAAEERQRFVLSAMLVLTGCLESVQFVFGVLVIAYIVAAIRAAMLWRLSIGAEAARASRAATDGFAPPLEIVVGRRAQPQFRRLVAGSALVVFAGAVGVFLLFPRFAQFGGGSLRGARSVSGFTSEIRLRGGDRITESRRELFTLRLVGADGVPFQPLRPPLLRGAVLDSYDPIGERWIPSRGTAGVRTVRTPRDGGFAPIGRGRAEAPRDLPRAEIEMRALATEVVFSLYAPVEIATAEPRTLSIDPATLLVRDVSTDRLSRYWSYQLRFAPQPSPELLATLSGPFPPPRRADASWFPVNEVRPIAESILAEVSRGSNLPPAPGPDAPDAERYTYAREAARAIASWMRANFRYTTDLSDFTRVSGEDPIVAFLARHRAGHCEFFASGLCAVLRSLDIDSRIVTGFIAIEYDEAASQYIVRESNAHAWVEVRTGPLAWTAVDATPEDSLVEIQERNRSFADRFRWIYGKLEFLWNSRVVSYDSGAQATIAGRVQRGWRDAVGERLSSVLGSMRALAASLSLGRAGGAWFAVIAIGLSTAGLATLLVAIRRRRLRRTLRIEGVSAGEQRRVLRDAGFYAEALQVLERAGLAKPSHRTPRMHADALEARHPAAAAAFRPIAEAFYKVRYGAAGLSREEAKTCLSLVAGLRAAVGPNPRLHRAD